MLNGLAIVKRIIYILLILIGQLIFAPFPPFVENRFYKVDLELTAVSDYPLVVSRLSFSTSEEICTKLNLLNFSIST